MPPGESQKRFALEDSSIPLLIYEPTGEVTPSTTFFVPPVSISTALILPRVSNSRNFKNLLRPDFLPPLIRQIPLLQRPPLLPFTFVDKPFRSAARMSAFAPGAVNTPTTAKSNSRPNVVSPSLGKNRLKEDRPGVY